MHTTNDEEDAGGALRQVNDELVRAFLDEGADRAAAERLAETAMRTLTGGAWTARSGFIEPEDDLAHHGGARLVKKDTETRFIRYHCGCLVFRVQVVACTVAKALNRARTGAGEPNTETEARR